MFAELLAEVVYAAAREALTTTAGTQRIRRTSTDAQGPITRRAYIERWSLQVRENIDHGRDTT